MSEALLHHLRVDAELEQRESRECGADRGVSAAGSCVDAERPLREASRGDPSAARCRQGCAAGRRRRRTRRRRRARAAGRSDPRVAFHALRMRDGRRVDVDDSSVPGLGDFTMSRCVVSTARRQADTGDLLDRCRPSAARAPRSGGVRCGRSCARAACRSSSYTSRSHARNASELLRRPRVDLAPLRAHLLAGRRLNARGTGSAERAVSRRACRGGASRAEARRDCG